MFLAKWMWEEANHCTSFEYVLETFNFDRDETYGIHLNEPSMKAKEDFVNGYTAKMIEPDVSVETVEGKKDFIKNLVRRLLLDNGQSGAFWSCARIRL
ncbi:MAG: hypothetical protein HC906_12865 [Bacteroidales bacterium]|nr:hypothetical protein [Bacteroidales bacterium]